MNIVCAILLRPLLNKYYFYLFAQSSLILNLYVTRSNIVCSEIFQPSHEILVLSTDSSSEGKEEPECLKSDFTSIMQ